AAAKMAGLEQVPCAVANMTPAEQFHTMMVENMQREDLTPIEQADGFQMMLDLGYSKEDITAQTGFSRTTIDHRLKMRELDRKKFTESQERGGTITDYIALEQIEDPKEKNRVLGYIGTADFRNMLQRAVNEQEAKKEKKKIVEFLKEKGCKKMAENDAKVRYYGNKWEQVKSFIYELKDAQKIHFVPGVEYFYYQDYSVSVYKRAEKKKEEKRPQIEIDLEKWEKEGKAQLDEIKKRHKTLRMNFMKGLSDGMLVRSKKFTEVMKYAAMELNPSAYELYGMSIYSCSDETFYEVMGVEEPDFYGPEEEKEKGEARKLVENNFVKSLAAAVYARLEDQAKFYKVSYDKEFIAIVETEKLMYSFLEALGYEASTEEKQMLDGTLVKELNDRRPGKK
ncbi:MAG: hypothetical protein KBS39_00955, partial [Lachnospiraceae bacterium]|nr:hypothetical protein [Candidatus Hippenecus merdae]